jgi:hypothetical protein
MYDKAQSVGLRDGLCAAQPCCRGGGGPGARAMGENRRRCFKMSLAPFAGVPEVPFLPIAAGVLQPYPLFKLRFPDLIP